MCMRVCYYFALFVSKLKKISNLWKARYVFPSIILLCFCPTSCFGNNNQWISKTSKLKKIYILRLLSVIPLRPSSERRSGRSGRYFYFHACGQNPLFSFILLSKPSSFVGTMEITLTDRCSYWSCNKFLKNIAKTAASLFCVLWCIC